MGKKKIIITCLLIITGSFLGAFLLSLLIPGMKERVLMVALGASAGIIISKYLIKEKTS